MRLIVFDIDGTLTETMKVDEECFVRALTEVFGFEDIDSDWSHYPHATDSGIFHEIYSFRTGRAPAAIEVSRFRKHFVDLLTAASTESPFACVAGAKQLVSQLASSSAYRVSLATGAWRDSARLKMASAGMCFDDHPSASSDDAFDRESIIRLSMQRAIERFSQPFACSVYIGDGIWDAQACRALRIPFIGIGAGRHAERLVAEGAFRVFGDLSESDLFLDSLDEVAQTAV